MFLQLVSTAGRTLRSPGQPYTFGVLKRAQARGDLKALRGARLPRAARVLGEDVPLASRVWRSSVAAVLKRGAPSRRPGDAELRRTARAPTQPGAAGPNEEVD